MKKIICSIVLLAMVMSAGSAYAMLAYHVVVDDHEFVLQFYNGNMLVSVDNKPFKECGYSTEWLGSDVRLFHIFGLYDIGGRDINIDALEFGGVMRLLIPTGIDLAGMEY